MARDINLISHWSIVAEKIGQGVKHGTLAERPRDINLFSHWSTVVQKVETGVKHGTSTERPRIINLFSHCSIAAQVVATGVKKGASDEEVINTRFLVLTLIMIFSCWQSLECRQEGHQSRWRNL